MSTALILLMTMLMGYNTPDISIESIVPAEVQGWKKEAKGSLYDRKTLFNYIDGGAEVYLAYDFREAYVVRFTREEHTALEVAVFDMGTPRDACGIFSYEMERDDGGIGQGSEYAAGLLRFWKYRYFVCVMAEEDSATYEKGAKAVADAIARSIPQEGRAPGIVDLLPREALIPFSTRYFHTFDCLNRLYYVANKNILHLDGQTEAVIARWSRDIPPSYLLLICYRDCQAAEKAFRSFCAAYLPEAADGGPAKMENGRWTGALVCREYVAVVFDGQSKDESGKMLQILRRKLEAK